MIVMARDDRTEVHPGLFQGARPSRGDLVASAGFHALVLFDDTFQPPRTSFPGVRVLKCPFVDSRTLPITPEVMEVVLKTARRVARRVARGERVLVTCFAGQNRSGLVVAHALHKLTGWSGNRIVRHIQNVRQPSLTNAVFVRLIAQLPGVD